MRELALVMLVSAAGAAAQQDAVQPCDLVRSATLQQSGREALDKQLHDTAAERLQEAFDACPGQRGVLLDLSQAYVSNRNFKQAIRTVGLYLEAFPDSIPGRLLLANAYFMDQQLKEAKQAAEEVLKSQPGEPAALKLKGNSQYLLGEVNEAQKTMVELLDRHPDDEDAAYMLGRIYYQEGRIDHAIGQFLRVVKLNPNSYKAYDNLGLCYEARSQLDTAIRYYLTAIRLVEEDHPEYDWPYANLANLLIDKGETSQAFSAAVKAAKRNPSSARNFYLGGKALWKLEELELSLKWLQRAVELDPDYPEPLYLLARVCSQLGKEEEARSALQKFREVKARTPRQRR